jgi:hypothetical protein
VIVPLPLPPEGVMVSQSASKATAHDVFELIVNDVLPASEDTSLAEGVTESTTTPFW